MFVDLAWLETADLPSYLTEKDCRQRLQFAVKSSTLDSNDMPSSCNHSDGKTYYCLLGLTFFFDGVCANVSSKLHSELQSLCSTNSVREDDMGIKIL